MTRTRPDQVPVRWGRIAPAGEPSPVRQDSFLREAPHVFLTVRVARAAMPQRAGDACRQCDMSQVRHLMLVTLQVLLANPFEGFHLQLCARCFTAQ